MIHLKGHKLITPAESLPVTLAEAKLHARVDSTLEDDLINSFIESATQAVEHGTGRQLVTATWRMSFDCPQRAMELYKAPVQSITSLKYINPDGDEVTVDAADYALDIYTSPARLVMRSGYSWPSVIEQPSAVFVDYVAGYGEPAAVPAALKTAIKLLVTHFYKNREATVEGTVNETPLAVETLINLYRIHTV